MRIIAVAAVSQDGFITRGKEKDVRSWTSDEDKEFFNSIRTQHSLLVMGSGTYAAVTPKPSGEKLRVVLTHKPKEFREVEVKGQLEFHNFTPRQFINSFEDSYKECLVLGGRQVYSDFLRDNFIDDFYLVIEPITHGNGTRLLDEDLRLSAHLTKKSTKTLNQKGTLLEYWTKSN